MAVEETEIERIERELDILRARYALFQKCALTIKYILAVMDLRISKLHYYVTMWGDYDKGWSKDPLPMAGPSKELPPDAPPEARICPVPPMST